MFPNNAHWAAVGIYTFTASLTPSPSSHSRSDLPFLTNVLLIYIFIIISVVSSKESHSMRDRGDKDMKVTVSE